MKRFCFLLLLAGCASAPPDKPAVTRGADATGLFHDGRLPEAEDGFLDALAEDRFAVDLPAQVKHLNNLGVVAMYEGRLDDSERRFEEALDLCAVEGTAEDRARLSLQLACVHLRKGNLDRAGADLDAAASWAGDADAPDRAQFASLRAGLALRKGDAASAVTWSRKARKDAGTPEEIAGACVLLGRALDSDPPAARGAFQEGLDAAREAGHLPLAVECLLGISRGWEIEDAPKALRYARMAHDAAQARGWEEGRQRAEKAMMRLAR